MKNIYFIIAALFLLFYVIHIVRKGKLSIKESFWWVIGALIALVLAIFPKSIDVIAKWFGVSYPPTLMFAFCILFLLFMNFRASAKVSEQNEKIMELTQQMSILKNKIDKRN
jgi:hypothetical protein